MNTSSAMHWPTSQSYDPSKPGLADQVAWLLAEELQVMVAITGPEDGRMTGFLADLTHAASKRCTVLRIKVTLTAAELFQALAGQLGIATEGLNTILVAARVGQRLSEKAGKGHYVLLCEGAHSYSPGMLEVVRQLSNYPINIVLIGRRGMLRRFRRATGGSLNQRINYQLDMSSTDTGRWLKHLLTAIMVAALAYVAAQWLGQREPEPVPAPIPAQRITPAMPVSPPEPALAPTQTLAPGEPAPAPAEPTPSAAQDEVPLVLDTQLRTPQRASH